MNHPVRNEAIEEEVREAQKIAHVQIDFGGPVQIGKLAAQAAQRATGLLQLLLRLIDFTVLEHGGEEAAAQHVPDAPVACALEAVLRVAQRDERVVRGVDGLVDLLIVLHISHIALLPDTPAIVVFSL